MTEEEIVQKSKDEFISKYGEGTQLITWGVAKVIRDVSDDFAHTFDYHVYGNDGENLEIIWKYPKNKYGGGFIDQEFKVLYEENKINFNNLSLIKTH